VCIYWCRGRGDAPISKKKNCKSWAAAHYIKLIVQSVGQTTPPRPAKVVDECPSILLGIICLHAGQIVTARAKSTGNIDYTIDLGAGEVTTWRNSSWQVCSTYAMWRWISFTFQMPSCLENL
jgi:hypothetical protein